MVAHPGPGRRQHGGPQHRVAGPPPRSAVPGERVRARGLQARGHQRLFAAGEIQSGADHRRAIQPGDRARWKDDAAQAGRRRQPDGARRSGREGRRRGGILRLRALDTGVQVRRFRGLGFEGQDCGLHCRRSVQHSGKSALALFVSLGALEGDPQRRRDWRGGHRESEVHGHSLGALDAGAAERGDGIRRRELFRYTRPAIRRGYQPRARRAVFRSLRPHLRRVAGAGGSRQAAAAFSAAYPSARDRAHEDVRGGIAERDRRPARFGPRAQE